MRRCLVLNHILHIFSHGAVLPSLRYMLRERRVVFIYRLYNILKKDFIITNDATFVLSSALNSSDINKSLSVQAINKIYDELMRTDGATVTSGLL